MAQKVFKECSDCSKKILEAKNNYILKMSTKLQDPKTAAKICWVISSELFYNKKIPSLPP